MARNTLATLQEAGTDSLRAEWVLPGKLSFVPATSDDARRAFDEACARIHYAGACRRVGRRLRLALIQDGRWVGGIVLGSPFPNLRPRDDAFGLTRWVTDWQDRGLISPWASENEEYWARLQYVVNQARAFVFPSEAGSGLGTQAHALLETEGLGWWGERYGPAAGFDTLCNHSNSKLFSANGWLLVGRTLGYSRDETTPLSRRVLDGRLIASDNAGLSREGGGVRWWIWVRILRPIRLRRARKAL